ncbi:Regulatory protein rop [Klebsiella quasipneumoniae subsp. quasipneumoniae]|nr:Regulatory protein rop [Klebsiella quasipneumoniae subsp. quasipneumoniae]
MTKQQKTALNMAKFIQHQSLLLLEKGVVAQIRELSRSLVI